MVTIDEYKKYLLNIEDNYLEQIINDTYDFIKDIFLCESLIQGYCELKLKDNTVNYISLNIPGTKVDELYTDIKGRLISNYILKQVFGDSFIIYIQEDMSFHEELGIISNYSLYMQGFPNNLDEIKNELFGNSLKLEKTLD